MKRIWLKITILLLIVAAALLARFLLQADYLDVHFVKQHKDQLLSFIGAHYIQAVLCFVFLYICTAFFLPGALALTVAGGMLFGTLPAVIYVNMGATIGAVLAFMAARFVIGGLVQKKFSAALHRFNWELSQHGHNYLLILRILPIAPFMLVNYCAGITKIPLSTFTWTTAVGVIPGSLIYAFVGEQLRNVHAPADLFSWKIMLALLLLALFALLPVILRHRRAARK